MDRIEPSAGADHICVLVHGLWGNPGHLKNLAAKLTERYEPSQLHVLVAKRNSDSYTYDGIEVGAERVAAEIEEELELLQKAGNAITKISIVGYSLGGLIARYCIGLLYSRGWFKPGKLTPVNFTAFASPFLGVRTPVRGYHSNVWNALGGRSLSASGAQLFLVDEFRDTGRPLLSVLTDPGSIFIKALSMFKHRVLYANIQNDRSAPWFTTGISREDPYEDMSAVELNFVKGYGTVICDPENPVKLKTTAPPGMLQSAYDGAARFASNLPFYAVISIIAPLGTAAFLINSQIQNVRSSARVKLHNEGKAGAFDSYRIPLMLEGAVNSFNRQKSQEYLSVDEAKNATSNNGEHASSTAKTDAQNERAPVSEQDDTKSNGEFPTLALAPEQFGMIEELNNVGFRKYPVNISLVRHTHAAIIVRMQRENFKEGYEVMRHWLEEEFEL